MINTFKEIENIAKDIRLNPLNTKEIVDFKLRIIEDICTKSIIAINEMRNGNN